MTQRETPSDKSYTIAVVLSAVFGVVGIQHFYLGRLVEAVIDSLTRIAGSRAHISLLSEEPSVQLVG